MAEKKLPRCETKCEGRNQFDGSKYEIPDGGREREVFPGNSAGLIGRILSRLYDYSFVLRFFCFAVFFCFLFFCSHYLVDRALRISITHLLETIF